MTIRQDVFNALQERGQATAKSLAIALNLKHSQAREALGKMAALGIVRRDGNTWHAKWRCVPGACSPDDRRGKSPGSAAGRKLGPGAASRLGILGKANVDPSALIGMSNTAAQNYLIRQGKRIASKQRTPKKNDCALWNIMRGPLK